MANPPRISFSLLCLLVLGSRFETLNTTAVERSAFDSCMETRQRYVRGAGWEITKEDIRFCRLSARKMRDKHLRLNRDEASLIPSWDPATDAEELSLQYFKGLGMWKNGDADIGSALLDKVAPCWNRNKSLKEKWSSLYHGRRGHQAALFKVQDQRWQEEEGLATFMLLDSSIINIGNLEAGELLLQRLTSADIGENFGRYSTTVYIANTSRTLERIHADWQATCWSNRADTMALDLDVRSIKDKWIKDPMSSVQLRVRVQARRQYLVSGHPSRNNEIPVIRQVLGLMLYFTQSVERVSSHLLGALGLTPPITEGRMPYFEGEAEGYLSDELLSAVAPRQRRSASLTVSRSLQYVNTRPPPIPASRRRLTGKHRCHRTSYRLDRDVYDNMNIRHPEYGHALFDIGECSGDCPRPLTLPNLNATNHAVVISLGASSDSSLTICCTPLSYGSLTYTFFHKNTYIQRELENFVAASCGCR